MKYCFIHYSGFGAHLVKGGIACSKLLKTLITLIIIFSTPSFLFAQSYSFTKYSVRDGLRPSALNIVFHDSRGYMWFGGNGGFCRYDGDRFIPYLINESASLIVKDIIEDENKNLWIATEGRGIIKYKWAENKFEWMTAKQGVLPSDSVYSIFMDKNKNKWIATARGVVVIRNNRSSFFITKMDGLYSSQATKIIEDFNGAIWIAAGGITKFNLINGVITKSEQIFKSFVLSLILKKDSSIVWGTNEGNNESKGIFSYKNNKLTRILSPNWFTDPIKTRSLLEDDNGNLWVGTTRGCIIIRKNVIDQLRLSNGLSNETISSMCRDSDGSIWFSTDNGAMKLSSRYLINYTEMQGMKSSAILEAHNDKLNNTWIGGWSGLYRISANGKLKVMGEVFPDANNQIHSLAEDNEGTIWVGTFGSLLKYANGKFSKIFFADRLYPYLISSLCASKNGSLWIGLGGEIINLKNDKIFKSYKVGILEPFISVSALEEDKNGKLWFGTDGEGCGYISKDSIKRFTFKDGIPDNSIESITEDSKGRIWIATRRGVIYFQDDQVFIPYSQNSILKEARVISVMEDKEKFIWFGTWFGAYRWNDSIIVHYDMRDGLPGDCVNAITEDKEGNIWFSTNAGVSMINWIGNPGTIPAADIKIEMVNESSKDEILINKRYIPYNDKIITFKIISLNYFDEKNMEFQSKLEGMDNQWYPIVKTRIVRYYTLPPGEFTFLVRAKNRNGKWSNPAAYYFQIMPPYWQTWWFRIVVSFLITGILFLIYKNKTRTHRKEKIAQQEFSRQLIDSQEMERKRIASELHDGLGQNLLIIKNRARMAEKNNDPQKIMNQINIISNIASESIADVRKISYNLHPYFIDEVGITGSLKTMISKFEESIPIKFFISIDNIDDCFSSEFQINIYRVIQEAVNNIIKHSEATEAKLFITKNEGEINISIEDNGKGFSGPNDIKNDPARGFGLKSINERIKFCRGHFDLQSAPGKGTIIKIKIPITKNEKN